MTRILNIDVECSPAQVYVWDLRVRGYINPGNVIIPKKLLCLAAKWLGDDDIIFLSEWRDGRTQMVRKVWDLLDEADAVLHYNGVRFDVPVINTEFAVAGLPPPSPYSQIDLYRTCRSRFAFMSNSLDYVTKTLGTVRKLESGGMDLWVRVLDGDREAQKDMETYNRGDVLANEDLHRVLLPWIQPYPNRALIDGGDGCPQCGGGPLRPRGFSYTAVSRFPRFRCDQCGKWLKGGHRAAGTDMRGVA